MTLIEMYEKYTKLSKNLVEWLEKQVDTDFEGNEEEIVAYLQVKKEEVEHLGDRLATFVCEESDENNLKDMQYLMVDLVFLLEDMSHFYKYREVGRLKMRAINYINKIRRAELYKEQ